MPDDMMMDAANATVDAGVEAPRETADQGTAVDPARAARVKARLAMIAEGRSHHAPAFKRMREDMNFALGKQWPNQTEDDQRYVANITQRHITQRVSALYAKHPKVIARRAEKRDFAIWDEKPESLQMAMTVLQSGLPDPNALALVDDVMQGMQRRTSLDALARTMEIVYAYILREQTPDFKTQMKQAVRRALTAGIGWVKLGMHRAFQPRPDAQQGLADATERLAYVERLQASAAKGDVDPYAAEADELRAIIAQLQQEPEIIAREGIVFDYPMATSIILDPNTRTIRGYVGCDWAAEQFMMTADKIKEVYGRDVKASETAQSSLVSDTGSPLTFSTAPNKKAHLRVYEFYHRPSGMMEVLCEGYDDFLREPAAPPLRLEQFYPWYPIIFNDIEHEGDDAGSKREIYPISDVRMLKSIQREYNRNKEALRQHRIANRPLYVAPAGAFSGDDEWNMARHPSHAIVKLEGLKEGEAVGNKLQRVDKQPIDPNQYETNGIFEDLQRVVGSSEASLGATSGATATESSIAAGSQLSSTSSNEDDLDGTLTAIARDAGQVMLLEYSAETVQKIAGRGAVWPEVSRQEVVEEVHLETEAGSSGRPNKAQDIANFERMAPFIVQVPGVRPDWLARYMIKIMDDRIDLTDAYLDGLPSITAMNQAQPSTGDPATDPNQQGQEGGDNAERAPDKEQGSQPAYPAPATFV